ncbi:NADH:flavin oxidoreductase [Candidatus Thorarchaeota archaeon]|nr:MAG: NADH:flavin oxidoreductase [Candidatus Thorarchaeota archaeon]
MSILFEPLRIGTITMRNRFMRSATTSAHANADGTLRQPIIELYRELARGEIGLIVTGHLFVLETGKAHEGMAGISQDGHVRGLSRITHAVHENGGAVVAQLNHAGIQCKDDRAGPSEYRGEGWQSRALSEGEIEEIIAAFGDSAQRAIDAGFDGVQIHGAHGYLVSQFLSRLVNKRNDQWGGSLENRMGLLEAVYDEIRSRVGGLPAMLKLNCDDFSPNGFTLEDSIFVVQQMLERGIDLIEISGGGVGRQKELMTRARHEDATLGELPFAGHAARIREQTRARPMALVNGFRTHQTMEDVLQRGLVDVVSMSRPFIRNPTLIKDLRNGQQKVTCTRCDRCLAEEVFGKEMLRCHLD